MSFPEEPLDSAAGYFAAYPGQHVHNGQWTIVRKLGWGPRSSTWLAMNDVGDDCVVLKIFTVSATQDASAANEQKFLYLIQDMSSNVPRIDEHFYEESSRGKHLCLALHALTFSVETLRLSNVNEGRYLLLHIVQKILPDILTVLGGLARKGIIHGAVLPDNLLFWSLQSAPDVQLEIERSPCSDTIQVTGSDGESYRTLKSQPMPQDFEWNTTRADFARASVYLSNFSYASYVAAEPAPFKSPATFLPPEALLGGRVDSSVDIWMLACTAYLLATGTPLFSDAYVLSPLKVVEEKLPKLEELLAQNGKVSAEDIPAFCSFLRACLVNDPAKRASVMELFQNKWIERGIMCSCGWCAADPLL